MDSDTIPLAKREQPAVVSVILESLEAAKESARRVQPVPSKTPKECRSAKNVQSTRISPKLASPPKQTVRNVRQTRALDQHKATLKSQHVSAEEQTFTKAYKQHA